MKTLPPDLKAEARKSRAKARLFRKKLQRRIRKAERRAAQAIIRPKNRDDRYVWDCILQIRK